MGKVSKFSTMGSKVRKLVLILAVIYTIILIINQQMTLAEINREMNNYSELLSNTRNENQEYQNTIKKFEDLEYIETIARKELGLVRETEKVYIFSK